MKQKPFVFFACFLLFLLNFRCGKSNSPEITFGVISDIQYCDDEPSGTRYYRNSIQKLEESVQKLNSQNLDFAIQLGDLIDKDLESYDTILQIYKKLNMKSYHVLGNHEFSVADSDKKNIFSTLGLENGWYDFKIKNWRFVVLDGNDLSFQAVSLGEKKHRKVEQIYNKLKNEDAENAQKWNGALSQEQLNWLRTTLEKSNKNKEKVILFCHFPVLPFESHVLWNAKEIIDLIEKYDGVVAYINGHNHQGNYIFHNNIHFLNIQGMVETPDQNSYAVVELYSDSLKVNGFGQEPSRVLHF